MEKAALKPALTYASGGVSIVGEEGDLQQAIGAQPARRQIHKTPADKYAGAPMHTDNHRAAVVKSFRRCCAPCRTPAFAASRRPKLAVTSSAKGVSLETLA